MSGIFDSLPAWQPPQHPTTKSAETRARQRTAERDLDRFIDAAYGSPDGREILFAPPVTVEDIKREDGELAAAKKKKAGDITIGALIAAKLAGAE